MKIYEVAVKNVNGLTGKLELTGKDILIGPNGAGKSTYLKAVGLAFRGKDADRRIGAQPISIRRLASGEEMAVSVAARDGERKFGLSREYREKDGSGEQTIKVAPSRDEKTQAQLKARIAEELGDFPVIFDWEGEYGSLSDDKKRDYIFQLCAGEVQIAKADIREKIEAGIVIELEDGEKEQEIYRDWTGKMLEDWDESQPFMTNFNRILAFLSASEKELNKAHKEAQAAAKKLVEMKNSQPENLTQFNSREIREKIEGFTSERRRLDREIATTAERIRSLANSEIRVAQLTAKIQELPILTAGQKAELDQIQDRSHAMRNELQSIQAKKQRVASCPVGKWDCEDLLAKRDEIEAVNAELEAEYNRIAAEVRAIEIHYDDLRQLAEKSGRRDFFSDELRKLQAEERAIGPVGDIDQMRQQVAALDITVSKLEAELQEKERAKLAWEQAESAALSRETLEIEIAAVKALKVIVGARGIQGDIVREIMKPLAKLIQVLMVGEGTFDFRMTDENGKEVFEIGFSRGGQFIVVPSGGEEILFRTALLAALVAQKSPKCRILLFELAECDRENGYRLLEALGRFVDQGRLDNVLVASCHDMQVPGGWRAHFPAGGDYIDIETDFPAIVAVDGTYEEELEPCPEPTSRAIVQETRELEPALF